MVLSAGGAFSGCWELVVLLNIWRLEETDAVGVRLAGTVRQKVLSSLLPPFSHPLGPPVGQNLQEAK